MFETNPTVSDSTPDARRLVDVLRTIGPAVVAFSGGVDSAVVAKAAVLAFPNALAATGLSPSVAVRERNAVAGLADEIGIPHTTVDTTELADDDYAANRGDRCYFCKANLYGHLARLRDERGYAALLDGKNADDRDDDRPGHRAAREHGVRSPLAELGIGKAGVRTLARAWGLSISEKPAAPCLASRVAVGVSVTAERLRRIDAAEEAARRRFGLDEFRVRLDAGEVARLEAPMPCLAAIAGSDELTAFVGELMALGFRRVTLDLAGFRSGSGGVATTELVQITR